MLTLVFYYVPLQRELAAKCCVALYILEIETSAVELILNKLSHLACSQLS